MRKVLAALFLLFTSLFSAWAQPAEPATDTLVVAYKITPPFITRVGEGGPNIQDLQGPSAWLWERIAESENLVFTLREMSLDSIVSGLSNGSVDVAINPLTITHSRSRKIDFSPAYYVSSSAMLVPKTSWIKRAGQFLGSFFSINFLRVLGALFVVLLFFGFLTWLFERKANAEEFGNGIHGLWNGMWWAAVTMTTVGYGDKSPRTIGGRIVALIWMFAAILMISGFTAAIASSLTVHNLGAQNESVESLKEDPIAVVKGSATAEWLRDHFYRQLKPYSTLEEAKDALQNKQVKVVAHDRPLLNAVIEADSLVAFEVMPADFNKQLYAMGLSYNLPPSLRRDISSQILQLGESKDWNIILVEYGLEYED